MMASRFLEILCLEIIILFMLKITMCSKYEIQWSRYPWLNREPPIGPFYRRASEIPQKSPPTQCQCPPNKECVVEYKINEDAIDFLHLRGIMKDEDIKVFKKDIEMLKQSTYLPIKEKLKDRRRTQRDAGDECCCPPINVMMPTFITDKKFKEVVARMSKGQKGKEDKADSSDWKEPTEPETAPDKTEPETAPETKPNSNEETKPEPSDPNERAQLAINSRWFNDI